MADAPAKTPPPPQPIPPGTLFIKNPTGNIHDVSEDDPRTEPVVGQAKKAHNGWSLASDEEVAAYCEANNLIPPARAGKAKKAEPEAEAPKAEEAAEALAVESPAVADEAPAEVPAKKARKRRAKK